MRAPASIRARLVAGAAGVLAAFMAIIGLALQSSHEDAVRAAHYARLQSMVYLLLGAAEIDAKGSLVMPQGLAEPGLSTPGSGLYAAIHQPESGAQWRSPSAVGLELPFSRDGAAGEWLFDRIESGRDYLRGTYAVRWSTGAQPVPLVISVLEDRTQLQREVAAFARTLWSWLAAATVLLLIAQALLLQWGLDPLRRVAGEIRRVEDGQQPQVEGRYPEEIAALTNNINRLIEQERLRQGRYREALSFLAHSLKTPLAVLRNSADDAAQLPRVVAQQVSRMDDIVQHQLARAAASGRALFAAPLPIEPILRRIRDSLAKVYGDRSLVLDIDCDPKLTWRIEEGDAFEMFGNLMDNAAKWARHEIAVRVWTHEGALCIRIEDDGPGFSDTDSVLQLHVRGDEKVPGHGVGLAVVDELVTSHGGTLALARSARGGAQVDVVLPRP